MKPDSYRARDGSLWNLGYDVNPCAPARFTWTAAHEDVDGPGDRRVVFGRSREAVCVEVEIFLLEECAAEPAWVDHDLVHETARRIAVSCAQHRGWHAVKQLQDRSPHLKTTERRLTEMLVELRSIGVDVLESVRQAQHAFDRMGLEADVPICPPKQTSSCEPSHESLSPCFGGRYPNEGQP